MLLNRTTRSVQLTERGQIYLEDCKRILEDFEMAERRVRGEDAKPRGTLRVTAPVLFGRLYVLPIVNTLLHEHPALSIHLTLSDRNVNLFEEGVDVAVRVGELADSSLIAVRLGLATPVLVASPAYLQKRGAPASPAALSSHDIILFEGIGATNEWPFGADRKTVRVEPRLIVNGADAAIIAARGRCWHRANALLSGLGRRARRAPHARSTGFCAAAAAGQCRLPGAADCICQRRRICQSHTGAF